MDFDVLIIGSGAGGGVTALALCEQGFKVGLVERGPRFDPQKDYILNYPDWETRHDPLEQARINEQTINLDYRTKFEVDGQAHKRSGLVYHRVYGVGGSTLHYQGEAHRFGDHTFNNKTLYGWGVDWPINYADLAPYYTTVEGLLGVAGNPNNPFKPKREAFPTPAHALSPRSRILAESAKSIGMTALPNTLALPSVSLDGRLPCQHSGGCDYGCVFGAKSSVDQAIIPRAERTGNLSLLTETRALKLELNDAGEIESVLCANAGGVQQITARAFVLAGGAIETPRLMLSAFSDSSPNGYANNTDQVGRYFMETVVAFLFVELEADVQVYRGPPIDSRIWDFYKSKDKQTSGFVLGAAGYLYPGIGPTSKALKGTSIGRAHKQDMRNSFGNDLRLFAVTEQEPMAQNRVTLSEFSDDDQIPKVDVHSQYSKRDMHTIKVMQAQLSKWAIATPTKNIGRFGNTSYRSSATHVGGTCRMGVDPKLSVVDAFGKVHGQTNCYITDASVLPTQGAGDSPSLTIQALALRTAEKIAADLKA
jgi:choline dehydrogenase-like flavoprotein